MMPLLDAQVGLIIGVAVILFGLIWAVANYNALVRIRNHCEEAWAQIDTELKRRYDLIPNLVETVKGYARHERELFEAVAEARARALDSDASPGSQAKDETKLVAQLRRLLAVAEDYPELRADKAFLRLQDELVVTEDRIQAARRFYNGNVRDLNNRIEVFPSNIIASMAGFKKADFFEVEQAVIRQVPSVDMGDARG